MSHSVQEIKFTYQDYLLFPDDGKRHELIDGERYMTPAPSTKHQMISANLLGLLHAHLKHTRLGRVFAAPTDVVLSDLDVTQPDLLFIADTHSSIIGKRCIQGAPDLVIEILSETTRKFDEITKRKLYERYGVQEYWIVDPELDMIKIHRRPDDTVPSAETDDQLQKGNIFVRVAELTLDADDRITTPLLPDFVAALADVFT